MHRAPASPTRRRLEPLRVVHPFPSILDGVATAAIAVVAGGDLTVAVRLGLAMTLLQFAIGALNDIVDAPRDADRKPGKPIPAGTIPPGAARAVVIAGALLGLALSAPSGPLVLAIAMLGLATGVAYDLRLKGTPWAWMPFAIGIPLLPVYAWLGATGTLPIAFVALVPLAAAAGTAIAVGNALVDVERDRAARTLTPAVVLGPRRAWRALVGLHLVVTIGALVSLAVLGGGGPGIAIAIGGLVVAWLGVAVARGATAVVRERGWELQAIGIAALAAGWALAVVDGGG